MEKLKQIVFNVVFYMTVVAIIAALLFVMLMIVMKLNVAAVTGANISSKEKCVLIDPGHGEADGGAVSDSGVVEKDVNLDISLCLRDLFEASGITVKMTRDSDALAGVGDTFAERRSDDFKKRLEMYDQSGIDAVVSVHQNKFTQPNEHGAQVFYSPNDPRSEQLAACVRRSLVGLLQPDNKREITKAGSNIYLLNNCQNPCVLVECGFLSNPDEAALLADPEYRRQIAFAIYCGVIEYL